MLLKDKFYIIFLLWFISLLSIFLHYFKMFLNFGVRFVNFDCLGFGVPVTAFKGKWKYVCDSHEYVVPVLEHQMRHLFKMSNLKSRRIRLLSLVNTKEQIRRSEKKYININNNNNNLIIIKINNNNNHNLIVNSVIIYTGTNNKKMFKIESLYVCNPFIHSHYNKNNGDSDKLFKYNTW